MGPHEVGRWPSSTLAELMAEYQIRADEGKQQSLAAKAEANRPRHGSMVRKGRR